MADKKSGHGSPATRSLSMERKDFSPVLVLIVAGLGFGLYQAGIWSARRDVWLDGSLLYLARFTQVGIYFLIAYLFRNFIPSIKTLLGLAVGAFCIHFLLYLGLAIGVFREPFLFATGVVSNLFSGIANALVILLLCHLIASYAPRYSAGALAWGFLVSWILYSLTALMGQTGIVIAQPLFRAAGIALLFAAAHMKGKTTTPDEHPLQYGVSFDSEPARNHLRFLVDSRDWVFQVICATLFPFIFGFCAQLYSTGTLSDGLYGTLDGVVDIVVAALVLLVCLRWPEKIGFLQMFIPIILLYATGFLLMPLFWSTGTSYSGWLFKAGLNMYQTLILVLLARKSFENPRLTYLYFGTFLGLANVSYARLAEPLIMNGIVIDTTSVSMVAVVFLWILTVYCLLLFILQRTTYAVSSNDDGTHAQGSADAASAADPFSAKLEALSTRAGLTSREREVLIEMLHGYSMNSVADKLCISPETVRTHMKNIYQKTGSTNKQGLIKSIDDFKVM